MRKCISQAYRGSWQQLDVKHLEKWSGRDASQIKREGWETLAKD